jgi:hypothetical protein
MSNVRCQMSTANIPIVKSQGKHYRVNSITTSKIFHHVPNAAHDSWFAFSNIFHHVPNAAHDSYTQYRPAGKDLLHNSL